MVQSNSHHVNLRSNKIAITFILLIVISYTLLNSTMITFANGEEFDKECFDKCTNSCRPAKSQSPDDRRTRITCWSSCTASCLR